jgi:signal transduction histidine kinase
MDRRPAAKRLLALWSDAAHLRRFNVRRTALGVTVALVTSAAALGLAFLLDPLVHQSVFVVFLAAVTVSASVAGLGSGLLATLVGGFVFAFFISEPFGSLNTADGAVAADLSIFALVALLINALYARLRRAQRRETAARETAEQAARLRDGFLAAAAHDLRNPLTVMLGTCQTMRRRDDGGQAHDAQRCAVANWRIESNAQRLAAQIDELLDVARAEAGRPLGIRRSSVDLTRLVRHVVTARDETSRRHVIRFECPLEQLVVRGDAVRLERVVDNLIVNALKYSPLGGTVVVSLACEETPNGSRAALSVRDDGLGVPAADLARIFEPFRRGGNVGPISGTGLGLASARQIVEEHGGRIDVNSREGAGATFTVWLPVEARQNGRVPTGLGYGPAAR